MVASQPKLPVEDSTRGWKHRARPRTQFSLFVLIMTVMEGWLEAYGTSQAWLTYNIYACCTQALPVASIALLWEKVGVQWLRQRHRESANKEKRHRNRLPCSYVYRSSHWISKSVSGLRPCCRHWGVRLSMVHVPCLQVSSGFWIITQDRWIRNMFGVHGDRERLCHPLVRDSSANIAYIYWGSLWGETCCSVIDGKLQLKHAPAAKRVT